MFVANFSHLLLENAHMKFFCFWICSPTAYLQKSGQNEDQCEIMSLLCSKHQWTLILYNVQKDNCLHPLLIITD